MNRREASQVFAALGGAYFILSILGAVFLYAFRASPVHPNVAIVIAAFLGVGIGAGLYGISILLAAGASQPAPPAASAPPAAKKPVASAAAGELMAGVKSLIELENWKLAHQKAFELIEAYPESEEAAKLRKNLEFLQQKSNG